MKRIIRQITKKTDNGYDWLVETNETIDTVESLIMFLKQEGKYFKVKNETELFADPADCRQMDFLAQKEWGVL